MNKFLKTRQEIDEATKFIQDNGLIESGISAKNWECWQVMPYMKDGDWLDMGSDGGIVLPNLVAKGIKGKKDGIDLSYPPEYLPIFKDGIGLWKGDLMRTPFEDNSYDFITCLSVIEHQVFYNEMAEECARLLRSGGKLFLSCDFWEPKPDTSKTKLYSLDWNILDRKDILNLVDVLEENGLQLTHGIDWTLQDAVINPRYCSPCEGVEYTFGIFSFLKT